MKQVDVLESSALVTTEGLQGEAMRFLREGYRGLGRRNAKAMSFLLN
ncbi:MAG: hypothetical protein ACPGLY_07605 [Rubripirellula sp.]